MASSHWSLAHLLWSQEKLADADFELRDPLAIADRAYPEGSLGRAAYRLPLGNLLAERGRLDDAVKALELAQAQNLLSLIKGNIN